ncbi:MAG: phosphatidylserine/phosphatidylglycerophosphate/cardiolipin synthase family protein [Syntrophotaleaceae bacterium]
MTWTKGIAIGAGFLVGLWVLGRAFLTVQLPSREGRREAFPDPMGSEVTLREAFDTLPHEGGQKASLRLLEDNSQAWLERWRLLDGAGERLDICYFILKQDVFGTAFLGHLVQKAREGVEIRILLDAMGTKMSRSFTGNDYLDALVNTGNITIRMYRPLIYRYTDAFLTLNPAAVWVSEHDKILLADGRRALIGGRNISTEYFAPIEDNPTVFRDTDLVLSGEAIGAALQAAFASGYASGEAKAVAREEVDLNDATDELLLAYEAMDAWLHDRPMTEAVLAKMEQKGLPWLKQLEEMPHLRGALQRGLPKSREAEVRLLDSRTRLVKADDPITRTLIRLVRSAREEIFIQSPYLVLPREAVEVLAEAAERGVRITVITNSPLSSDNAMSQAVFLEQWPELLARVPGLELYVAPDRHNLHGKLAVFDRRLALVGTYNLDILSLAMNSELVAAIWSEAVAEEILQPRRRDIRAGEILVQYRIARTDDGTPRRGKDGRVMVEWGPVDHLDLDEMRKIRIYRGLYRMISRLKGEYPWY